MEKGEMSSAGPALLGDGNTTKENEKKKKDKAPFVKDSCWAWVACFCAVLDQLFITGVINVFGVFFVVLTKDFHSTKAETAWLGSLCFGILKLLAPMTRIVVTVFSNRTSMMTGLFICVISVFSSSYVTDLKLMFITFPVLYGIGSSLSINPSTMLPNMYFDHYYGVATGLVCAGSSLGSIMMAPLSQSLVDSVGWRVTFRILGVIFAILTVVNSLIKPIPILPLEMIKKPALRSLIEDLHLWKNRVFILWATATSIAMFGYFVPNVHMIQFAVDNGIPAEKAAMTMLFFGIATTFGRLLSGKILNNGLIHRLHLDQLVMVITGTAFMILPYISNYAGLVVYNIVTGLVDGCYIVLLPLLTYSLIGTENAALAWGYMCLTSSFTFTVGPATAGWLYDIYGNYHIAFHCAGFSMILGAVILFFLPWAERTSKTTNVMVVVSDFESGDAPSRAPSASFSAAVFHRECPRTQISALPFFIHPYFANSPSPRSRSKRTTERGAGTSAIQGGSLPLRAMAGASNKEQNAKKSRSEMVPDKYIIPRQNYEFLEGYLDQLKTQMTAIVHESLQSAADSSLITFQMSDANNTPTVYPSFSSNTSSALEQLVQEHIDLFLADLAARGISGLSISSISSRPTTRSRHLSTDCQTRQGQDDSSDLAISCRPEQQQLLQGQCQTDRSEDILPAVSPREIVLKKDDDAAGGRSELFDRNKSPPESHVSTADSTTSRGWETEARGESDSAMEMMKSKTSVLTDGSREIDMFEHLFKDDNT